jgi:hypothetical protein
VHQNSIPNISTPRQQQPLESTLKSTLGLEPNYSTLLLHPSTRRRLVMASNPTPPKQLLRYEDAVRKGSKLLYMMHASDSVAGNMFNPPRSSAQSTFLDPKDLCTSGYTSRSDLDSSALEAWPRMWTNLDIDVRNPSEGGDCTHMAVLHLSINAYFHSFLSPSTGVIMANNNQSPSQAVVRDNGVILPDLQHWSDVVYLKWLSLDPALKSRSLHYVLRDNLGNGHTLAVINRVLDAHAPFGKECPTWPGLTTDMDSKEGMALLGTPNGSGVAWLLIQHKAECQLGHKTVKRITLLWPDLLDDLEEIGDETGGRKAWGLSPSLLFWIEDVVV